ncbi:MAG: nitrilase-related carbon-nitrogen hydrolase [Acidimicrobiales bacterium]
MRIAVVQHEIEWESPQANFDKLRPRISEAADDGAGLITLTETYSWGFTMNTDRARETSDGPSTEFLRAEAARTGSWIVGSIPVGGPGLERPNNRMTFAGPSGELFTYDKIHPFSFSGEDKSYTAGTERRTFEIGGLRISPFVCFDLRFADEFWALAHDTDCYLVIANWPASRRNHWRALLLARAIENQAWVIGANRVGPDPNVDYCGDSLIVDPFGELAADAGDEATIISADIAVERVRSVRTNFPFLEDRR